MTGKLELATSDREGYRLLSLAGEVDMETSPQLRDELRRSLRGAPAFKVLLRDVRYLDSSGIAVLIQGLKWAQRGHIAYTLVDPSDQVRSVIELAMLHNLFTIETTGADG